MLDVLRRWAGASPGIVAGLLGAVVGALFGAVLDDPFRIGESALLAGAMAAIAAEDARRLRVPDSWNIVAALAGLAVVWANAGPGLQEPLVAAGRAAVQAALCGGVFLLLREIYFRLRGIEGLGLGDVKLAVTGGIWLGWQLFASAVMVAACGALILVVGHIAIHRAWPKDRRIAFAAFLAPAIWVVWYGAHFVRLA